MRLTRHRKTLPILALNLAIVLIVGGGTAAYGALNKTVTLSVDGHTQTIRTFGDTVSDVLKAKKVAVRDGDQLSPSASSSLANDATITVAYAKPLTLTVDGSVTKQTVYDATVGGALASLGFAPSDGSYLSAKRSAKLSRAGSTLVVSTPKALVVDADKKKKVVSTSAPTVGAALKAADITLDSDDEVSPGKGAFIKPGVALRVTRIKKVTRTETVALKYPVKVRKDSSVTAGETKIVTEGVSGRKQQKVELILADGKVRNREVLTSRTLSAPRPQIEARGTKPKEPAPVTMSTGDTVWDKIAECESGGNWSINSGNGYYGGLQFSADTWHSVGGPGLPHESTREVQIKFAKILQARSGWGQWGCAEARFN
ncbi:resuscitation-promoting factor [Aeromicrobium sp.]|uniref:resuscitation-promoting factor n=1 Tax=Aeromicrobium sp. TaxID=1871063 RepID=UPI001997F12A|nr:resuscitation-promoting factor [Aeromicrobium sp.]MBC7633021.1 transglycosylase family protein [Aeromicrobium sp.]